MAEEYSLTTPEAVTIEYDVAGKRSRGDRDPALQAPAQWL